MTAEIRINDALDPAVLGAQLKRERRLQIAEFLTPESAETVFRLIKDNRDWFLSYNEGENNVELPLADFQRMRPERRAQFLRSISEGASAGFQFFFAQYYITEAVRRGENPGHPLHAVHEFVNSEPWLAFMRTLTGEPAVARADCLASLYAPGHFLTDHDDRHDRHNRVAAYVLGMTRPWNHNWGGHLVFFDGEGNIELGLVPAFNTLNIFLVPQSHAVQPVAPFARGTRTSITGWLQR